MRRPTGPSVEPDPLAHSTRRLVKHSPDWRLGQGDHNTQHTGPDIRGDALAMLDQRRSAFATTALLVSVVLISGLLAACRYVGSTPGPSLGLDRMRR